MTELAQESGKSVAEIKKDVKSLAEEYQRQGVNVPLSWKKAYDEMGVYSEAAEKKMKKSSEETSESMKDDAEEVGEEHRESSKKASEYWDKAFTSIKEVASTGIKVIGTGIATMTTGVTALGTAAVNSYADYEQLVGGIETLFGTRGANTIEEYAELVGATTKNIADEFKMLEEAQATAMQGAANAYKNVGLSANEYMEITSSFAASLKQSVANEVEAAKAADQAVIDMADNANKMGTNMELIQNAYQGFSKQNYTMLDNLKLGYGGTATEMARLVNESGVLGDALIDLTDKQNIGAALAEVGLAKVYEAIHVVQTELGITGTTAKEASETISGSLAMTKAAWENLLVGLADDTQNFDALIQNFVESASTAVGNLLPRVEIAIGGIGNLIESLFPVIVNRIPEILNGVLPDLLQSGINMMTVLLEGIQQNLPQIMDSGAELLTVFIGGIVSMLPDLAITALEIIMTLYGMWREQFPVILEIGYELLYSLVEGIVSGIPEMLPKALDFIEQYLIGMMEKLPEFLQIGFELLRMLADGIVSAIPIMLPRALDFIQRFATNIAEMAPGFIQIGFELLGMFVDGIVSAIPVLIEKVPTIVSTFANIINDNFPTILLKGAELLGKLIKGILSAIPTLIANIPQIISAIVDTIMAFQWLNLGKNIMTSFKDGILKMKDAAKKAGESIHNSVKSAISNLPDTLAGIGKNGINGFANAIKNLKSTAVDAAKAIFNAVKDKFAALPNAMLDIGKNIVKGLFNGISDMTGWIAKKIGSFGEGIIDDIKDVFDIHSPSKKFEWIGNMCVAGFEQPMEEFNPYQSLQNNMEANIGTLKATFAKASLQNGSGFAFDYGQFGQEMKSLIGGMGVYMDSNLVGQLVTPSVNNELPIYSARRI